MKLKAIALCASLVLVASAAVAQERSNEDTSVPASSAPAPNPPVGNKAQNKNAVLSGHDGMEGTVMDRKQCQAWRALQASNPKLAPNAPRDRQCSLVLGETKGDESVPASTQNKSAAQSGHDGEAGTKTK